MARFALVQMDRHCAGRVSPVMYEFEYLPGLGTECLLVEAQILHQPCQGLYLSGTMGARGQMLLDHATPIFAQQAFDIRQKKVIRMLGAAGRL